jgi:GT2 family glycosyltransferase
MGGFRRGFDGSQDYDLVLRLSERTKNIHHVPKILYRWRMVPSSAAASSDAKPYAYEAAKKALSEHLNYRKIHGEILDGTVCSHYRIRFNIPHTEKVSIVIANTAKFELLQKCIASIETSTSYSNYEVIVVDYETMEPASREFLLSRSHRVVTYRGSGNSSHMINFGARHAIGNYLLLLHGDTEVVSADWITSMLGFCRLSEIGVVGAKLIDRHGRIQQAGLVLGLKGIAGYPLRKSPRDTHTNNNFAASVRNCSAVSGVCMMVRKSVFEQVGGFDENLSSAHNDVDFCLKVRESGYRIVWTPWAELYHEDDKHSGRRANSRELAYLKKRWGKTLMKDPYYNPNLTLRHEDLGYRV